MSKEEQMPDSRFDEEEFQTEFNGKIVLRIIPC